MLTHIRLRFIIPTIIAASTTGAAAMSSSALSSASTAITVTPHTSTQLEHEMLEAFTGCLLDDDTEQITIFLTQHGDCLDATLITRAIEIARRNKLNNALTALTKHAKGKASSALKNKPLASWTVNDLITWLNGDAKNWNPSNPMLGWFDLDLVQKDIHRIFEHHANWYLNKDAFFSFLEATKFLLFLTMNKHNENTVATGLFNYLHEFVGTSAKQPAPSGNNNDKEAKAAAPTFTLDDEPSIEDDHEIQAIITQQPKVIGRSDLNATLRLQPQALQEPHTCATCPAQKTSTKPKQQHKFQSRTYRRL